MTTTQVAYYSLQRRRGPRAPWEPIGPAQRDLGPLKQRADDEATRAYPGVEWRVVRALPAPSKVVHIGRAKRRRVNRHSRSGERR